MARFTVVVVMTVSVLAFWSTCAYASLTVNDQLQQLRDHYMETKELLTIKDKRLDALEQEIIKKQKILDAQVVEIKQLALKVELQESKLNDMQRGTRSSPSERISEGAQKLIGYVDVKTTAVYFLAHRYWDWSQKHTPVIFDVVSPNIGGALNQQTGRFIAPRTGKYFFFAAGVARFPAASGRQFLQLDLFWNNRQFATGSVAVNNPVAGHTETFSLQATLDIEAGDDVILMILPQSMSAGIVIEGGTQFQFTGFMLEEEIAQSPNVKQITY